MRTLSQTIVVLFVAAAGALPAAAQSVPAPSDQPAGAVASAPTAVPAPVVTAPGGSLTLGGVPQLLADKLQEAMPCGIVDFAGHVGGGAYVPTYTFHDAAGQNYVEALDIGYRALQNAKPSVYLMPLAFNPTALSNRLWSFPWAQKHVTRSPYPDVWVGVGPLLPLDKVQLQALKLNRPKDWLAASASVRFK